MKKRLHHTISFIFGFALFFGFFSCANNLEQDGNVSFKFSPNAIQNITARANEVTDSSEAIEIAISLTDRKGKQTTQTVSIIDSVLENDTVTFERVPVGTAEIYGAITCSGITLFTTETITVQIRTGKTTNASLTLQYGTFGAGTITVSTSDNVAQIYIDEENSNIIPYLNAGNIKLAAKDTSGNDITSDITGWTVALKYKQSDINGSTTYYNFDSNEQTVTINSLPFAATYYLYVTATYNDVISSNTFEITVTNDYEYYNLNAATYSEDFSEVINSMQNNAMVVISGTTTDTCQTMFSNISSAISNLPYEISLDLSELTTTETAVVSYSGSLSGCTSLVSISLPGTVKVITASAFSRCTNLTTVIIPDSVYAIGAGAFADCSNITDFTIGTDTNTYTWYYTNDGNYWSYWLQGLAGAADYYFYYPGVTEGYWTAISETDASIADQILSLASSETVSNYLGRVSAE